MLYEEELIKIENLREMSLLNLRNLREEISSRINWILTSEYYNHNKYLKLMKNEKKISKFILEKMEGEFKNEN